MLRWLNQDIVDNPLGLFLVTGKRWQFLAMGLSGLVVVLLALLAVTAS